jgi:hypothetical protein
VILLVGLSNLKAHEAGSYAGLRKARTRSWRRLVTSARWQWRRRTRLLAVFPTYKTLGISARRACRLFKVTRSALNYASRKAVTGAPVIKRMASLSMKYPRYGCGRLCTFLAATGTGRALAERIDCSKARGGTADAA